MAWSPPFHSCVALRPPSEERRDRDRLPITRIRSARECRSARALPAETRMEAQAVRRVLYVEDEPIVRRLVTHVMTRSGFEIQTANNGFEGVEMAQAWHPDLILMDLMMPVMDGYQAAKALREDPKTRDIPIVAYSASPPETGALRAARAGIDAFVSKETPHADLVAMIRARMHC